MKRIITLVLFMLLLLSSCGEVNLQNGKNELSLGEYTVSIDSNTDFLTVSLSEEDIVKYEESLLEGKMFIAVHALGMASHIEFETKESISDPSFWYTATGESESSGQLVEGSEVFLTEENIDQYRVKITFELNLIEDAQMDTYAIHLSDIDFPQCSVFSTIIVGDEGYQEVSSFSKELINDGYIGTITKGVKSSVVVYIYIDGNDENTNLNDMYANMAYLQSHFGNISFNVRLEEIGE